MTIKLRITLGFLCSIAFVAACVIGYTGWQMREDARGYFVTSSSQQLQLMEQSLRSFVNGATHNAQIIAEFPGLADAEKFFPALWTIRTKAATARMNSAPKAKP